jgi:hypothetical protein
VNEALAFHKRLVSAGLHLDAFVANRVLPAPGLEAAALVQELAHTPRFAQWPAGEREAARAALVEATTYLGRAAAAQARELERLAAGAHGVPIATLPLLPHEASSLTALRTLGNQLGGRTATPAAGAPLSA